MKIVFETTAGNFNKAAEYGILLRKVARQKQANITGIVICAATVVLSAVMKFAYGTSIDVILEVYILAALIIALVMDQSGSRARKAIRMFYRGQLGQTEAERAQILQLILEEDGKFHVYRDGIERSTWDCNVLKSAREGKEIFDLLGGGKKITALSIPKDALKEGRMEDFRTYISERLPKGKEMKYFEIPRKLLDILDEEKGRIFWRKQSLR